MKLSKNFYLSEFTKSQVAERKGIDNKPSITVVNNLKLLCNNVLQPLSDAWGEAIIVTSGYRSPKLNEAIGGSEKSQHCRGQAADIEVPGWSNLEVAKWIKESVDFDQLILEFYTVGQPNSGWVHVSYQKGKNRKQVLRAVKVGSKVKYLPGL